MKIISKIPIETIVSLRYSRKLKQYIFEYDYLPITTERVYISYQESSYVGINYDTLKRHLVFSKNRGVYTLKEERLASVNIYGNRHFPYKYLDYEYEAKNLMNVFHGTPVPSKYKETFGFLKDLPYTYGLEYETCAGFIPQEKLFPLGLIPLRDGSISGIEYASTVLKGNEGLNKIQEHCKTLKEYTKFNKECSLHIHFGGFPLNPDKITALYGLLVLMQHWIAEEIVPIKAFYTSEWKASKKDYCKLLPHLATFDEIYRFFVGTNYFGSLAQPHPADLERARKWQIKGRYYWVNLINMLCYPNPKTVELRILRPTYNYKKIIAWIEIFSEVLRIADCYTDDLLTSNGSIDYENNSNFRVVLEKFAREEVKQSILRSYKKLQIITYNQSNCGDDIGEMREFDELFD